MYLTSVAVLMARLTFVQRAFFSHATPLYSTASRSHPPLVALLAEDAAQRVADLAERGEGLDGGEDARQQVLRAAGGVFEGGEGGSDSGVVAAGAQLRQLCRLAPAHFGVHTQDRRMHLFLALEAVDADDDAPLLVQRALVLVGRLFDLALDVALLDGAHAAAQLINLGDVVPRAPL